MRSAGLLLLGFNAGVICSGLLIATSMAIADVDWRVWQKQTNDLPPVGLWSSSGDDRDRIQMVDYPMLLRVCLWQGSGGTAVVEHDQHSTEIEAGDCSDFEASVVHVFGKDGHGVQGYYYHPGTESVISPI